MTYLVRVMGFLMVLLPTFDAYSDAMKMEGSYTIPLPEELREHGVLEFDNYQVVEEAGGTFMLFQLPADLGDGSTINCAFRLIEKQTKTPFTHWASSQGELQCTGHWENMACVVSFNAIGLNQASRHQFLEAKYSDQPKLLSIKKEISDVFDSEPIGFIAIRKTM